MDSADKLTVVCWLWKSTGIWSHAYTAEHVNAFIRQCEKYIQIPHRVVCVTDSPEGINCETIPLWEQPAVGIAGNLPNCYKRLFAFSHEARAIFGKRFVSIDIDCVMMPGPDGRGITPLLETGEDFKIVNGWRCNDRSERLSGCCPYNGSMWIMNTGARAHVWDKFDPVRSPEIPARRTMPDGTKWFGSDQAWIAYMCPDEPTWCRKDGVYSYVRDMSYRDTIPEECRIMFFAGRRKPWSGIMSRVHPAIFNAWKNS